MSNHHWDEQDELFGSARLELEEVTPVPKPLWIGLWVIGSMIAAALVVTVIWAFIRIVLHITS